MSAVFELQRQRSAVRAREASASSPRWPSSTTESSRRPTACRTARLPGRDAAARVFDNAPDTDPSLPANRDVGPRHPRARRRPRPLGDDAVDAATIDDADDAGRRHRRAPSRQAPGLGRALRRRARRDPAPRRRRPRGRAAPTCSRSWPPRPARPSTRAIPRSPRRSTSPTTTPTLAEELDDVDGATFVAGPSSPSSRRRGTSRSRSRPAPRWRRSPPAPPSSSSPPRRRAACGAVMVEALWEAGVPRDVLAARPARRAELGRQLVSAPRAWTGVILTGGYETAELFRSFRNDLPLLAETSGKNAIIVTPSADLDLAVKDVVVLRLRPRRPEVLGGLAGDPRRLGRQVEALPQPAHRRRHLARRSGYPTDPTTQMGPIIEPANGKLLRRAHHPAARAKAGLVEPKQLDDDGRLWIAGRPRRRRAAARSSTSPSTSARSSAS